MKITVEAEPKEIADLVVSLQDRQSSAICIDGKILAKTVLRNPVSREKGRLQSSEVQ